MNKKTQLLLAVVLLGVVDAIVPFFPILALILVYVVLEKPPWFLESVQGIYNGGLPGPVFIWLISNLQEWPPSA